MIGPGRRPSRLASLAPQGDGGSHCKSLNPPADLSAGAGDMAEADADLSFAQLVRSDHPGPARAERSPVDRPGIALLLAELLGAAGAAIGRPGGAPIHDRALHRRRIEAE